jgi:hypothetical protein
MFGISLAEPVWNGRRIYGTEGDVAPSRDVHSSVACLTRTEPVLASDNAKLRVSLPYELTHGQRPRIHDDDFERVLEALRGERAEGLVVLLAGVVRGDDDAEGWRGGLSVHHFA